MTLAKSPRKENRKLPRWGSHPWDTLAHALDRDAAHPSSPNTALHVRLLV